MGAGLPVEEILDDGGGGGRRAIRDVSAYPLLALYLLLLFCSELPFLGFAVVVVVMVSRPSVRLPALMVVMVAMVPAAGASTTVMVVMVGLVPAVVLRA